MLSWKSGLIPHDCSVVHSSLHSRQHHVFVIVTQLLHVTQHQLHSDREIINKFHGFIELTLSETPRVHWRSWRWGWLMNLDCFCCLLKHVWTWDWWERCCHSGGQWWWEECGNIFWHWRDRNSFSPDSDCLLLPLLPPLLFLWWRLVSLTLRFFRLLFLRSRLMLLQHNHNNVGSVWLSGIAPLTSDHIVQTFLGLHCCCWSVFPPVASIHHTPGTLQYYTCYNNIKYNHTCTCGKLNNSEGFRPINIFTTHYLTVHCGGIMGKNNSFCNI